MIPTDRIAPFLLAAIVIILAPGPQVLFVVGRALAYGKRTALSSAAGGTFGAYVQAILVSLGLGTLVERSAVVYASIKLIGAAYLVFLGVKAFRHRHTLRHDMAPDTALAAAPDADEAQRARSQPVLRSVSSVRAARQGVLVGLTNPKAAIFFGAILPQFVDRSIGHVPLQMIAFATMFSSMAFVCDSAWGLVAGTARDWLARSPRRLELVGAAGGLAMVGLGVAVAVTGRKD